MKLKIDGKLYDSLEEEDFTKMPIGRARLLKREYGFMPAKSGIDMTDPDHQAAFYFMLFHKDNPTMPDAQLVMQVETACAGDIEQVNDDGSPITEEEAKAEAEISEDPTPLPTESESVSAPDLSEVGS